MASEWIKDIRRRQKEEAQLKYDKEMYKLSKIPSFDEIMEHACKIREANKNMTFDQAYNKAIQAVKDLFGLV